MNKITLGKTNLVIEKNGFGCLPIQRIREQDAVDLLHKAYDGGINFFDTARAYSDSEQKVGAAFSSMRDKIVLATKTGAQTAEGFRKDLETSLRTLKTDYIDIYQFHNPAFCPKPGGEDGLYDAALEAKKQGKIRHISITNHRLAVAHEAIDSGLYETLQFPFSYLAGEQEMELVRKCRETNMGFIAMKGMAGGLIRDGFTAAAWMAQQDGVVPIWGVQRESELDQFLQCIREGVELTDERKATIERDRKELCGEFCRGCGYCMPCPAGIEINQCARMSLMLRRAPAAAWLTEEWQQKMHQIENCRHCGHCMSKCPYGLNTPEFCRQTTRTTGKCSRPARRRNEAGFFTKIRRPAADGGGCRQDFSALRGERAVLPLPSAACDEGERFGGHDGAAAGEMRGGQALSRFFRQRNARRRAGPDRALPAR